MQIESRDRSLKMMREKNLDPLQAVVHGQRAPRWPKMHVLQLTLASSLI